MSDLAVDELSLLTAGFLAGMRWFGLPPTLVVAVAAVSLEELEQKIGLTSMFAFSVKNIDLPRKQIMPITFLP